MKNEDIIIKTLNLTNEIRATKSVVPNSKITVVFDGVHIFISNELSSMIEDSYALLIIDNAYPTIFDIYTHQKPTKSYKDLMEATVLDDTVRFEVLNDDFKRKYTEFFDQKIEKLNMFFKIVYIRKNQIKCELQKVRAIKTRE